APLFGTVFVGELLGQVGRGGGHGGENGPARKGGVEGLHAEEVAQLEEEAVPRTGQVAEPERVRLRERRAVTQEDDGPRGRLGGKQDVVAEVVRDQRWGRRAVHEERLPGVRV